MVGLQQHQYTAAILEILKQVAFHELDVILLLGRWKD